LAVADMGLSMGSGAGRQAGQSSRRQIQYVGWLAWSKR
jgi:hypothetical protein